MTAQASGWEAGAQAMREAVIGLIAPLGSCGDHVYPREGCPHCTNNAAVVERGIAAIRALAVPPPPTAPEVEGLWPANDLRRAFVMGAKWWEWHKEGATMWPSDRDAAEAEAERKYPGGAAPSGPGQATDGDSALRPSMELYAALEPFTGTVDAPKAARAVLAILNHEVAALSGPAEAERAVVAAAMAWDAARGEDALDAATAELELACEALAALRAQPAPEEPTA